MSTEIAKVKLPSLAELIKDTEMTLAQNKLMVLVNQNPHSTWVKGHPTVSTKNNEGKVVPLAYLPIERLEWLLSRIYGKWWVEILDSKFIANSVVVTVRVFVKNPLTGEIEHNDGIGATAIQTDKGQGAIDWNYVKSSGVQIAAPAAESYAFKDAVEKFGKVFGKDLNKKDLIEYDNLLKTEITIEDVRLLFQEKYDSLTPSEIEDANRIINNEEKLSYKKLHKLLIERV